MKPISLGLIGVGFHARNVHIPAIDLVSELRLLAIATSREQTAKQAAERYRVAGYADYRQLLARADVEAVIIATNNATSEEITRAALENGKHVLLETPGIPNLGAARELQQLASTKKLVTQVGFLTRYSQSMDVLKARLDLQPAPRLFCYEYFPYLAHTYNLSLYLSGPWKRVLSATSDSAGSSATIRFRNGDTAVIVGRSIANCSHNIERVTVSNGSFYGSVEGRTRVRIIDPMPPTGVDQWSAASSGGIVHDPQPFAARFLENTGAAPQLRGFAAAIRQGESTRSTFDDMIETRRLLEEAGRVAESQQT
jgi:predicted dehydrogenase